MTESNPSSLSTPLSEREIEILQLVARGATNQQIAVQLDISLNTVKVHMRNILAKTGTSSRTEASLYAVRNGIIQVPGLLSADSPSASATLTKVLETKRIATVTAPVATPSPETQPPPDALPHLPTREPVAQPDAGVPSHLPTREPVAQPDAQVPSPYEIVSVPAEVPIPIPGAGSSARTFSVRSEPVRWLVTVLLLLVIAAATITWVVSRVVPASLPTPTPMPISPGHPPAEDNSWAPRTAPSEARVGSGLTEYDGKLYLVGGMAASGVSNHLERYTPQSDTWTRLANKPTPVTDIQAVVIGEILYVPGGQLSNRTVSDQLEGYAIGRGRWITLPPLPKPRSQYAVAALDGKLYLFGGWDGQTYRAEVWMYDPDEQRWQERTSMPDARGRLSVTVVGNQIHLIGGEESSGPVSLHQVYHPSQDNGTGQPWSSLPPLPDPLNQLTAVTVLNNVYVFAPASAGLFVYDGEKETWNSFTTELPVNSAYLSAVLLNTNLHLVGKQTAGESGFHIEHQVIYRTQLPILPR